MKYITLLLLASSIFTAEVMVIDPLGILSKKIGKIQIHAADTIGLETPDNIDMTFNNGRVTGFTVLKIFNDNEAREKYVKRCTQNLALTEGESIYKANGYFIRVDGHIDSGTNKSFTVTVHYRLYAKISEEGEVVEYIDIE